MTAPTKLSRRAVLTAGVAGSAALVIGVVLRRGATLSVPRAEHAGFAPNAWIRIDRAGTVRLTIHKCEMGQGVLTALPMLLAEELEVDVRRVQIEQADADFRFVNQGTFGSSSVIESWEPLRRAGAVARVALLRAAAHAWGVSESQCTAAGGVVHHAPSGRTETYGALVATAATLPLPDPASIELKPPWAFKIVGRPTPRRDARDKVTGRQRYGMDVRLPGMLFATVLRCPVLSGRVCTVDPQAAAALPAVRLLSVDRDAARSLPGVHDVVALEEDVPSRLPPRVAIVARSTWEAFEALPRIAVKWDEGSMAALSSDEIRRRLIEDRTHAPLTVRDSGQAPQDSSAGADLAAEYELPFLAHAALEPVNCTARVQADAIEIWAPTQHPQRAVDHVARITRLPRDRIRLHVVPMGGAFGRRASPDFVVEAVQISRAVRAPVQVVWTREQDMRQDFYRPASRHTLAATLDARGAPEAWRHRIAGPSINQQIFAPGENPIEGNEIDGAVNLPYRIPHVRVEWRPVDIPVPLGVWRSVAQSQNVFAVESFIDELAARAGVDPLAYRQALLEHEPRLSNVLTIAARLADWGATSRRGEGTGVALNRYGEGTCVAVVARVTIQADGSFRVARLSCAVDCGQPVNPLSLRAQIEGGLVWGLSATLHGRITLRRGRIEQSNFHDFPVLRMSEMPQLDVHVVESSATPGGIGEPCAPPVAPAVANALFAAGGARIRSLPLPGRL
jgi:CO/xanthine dehydrogenase Mo-binding subunit